MAEVGKVTLKVESRLDFSPVVDQLRDLAYEIELFANNLESRLNG